LLARGEIFVLDDDRSVREVLWKILTPAGYEVISFSGRLGLLAAAARQAPACILLDVYLPFESGLDVLGQLREENYHGPILMISGLADIATASEIVDGVSRAIDARTCSQAETTNRRSS
jgi:FixJ family two-component response regulator